MQPAARATESFLGILLVVSLFAVLRALAACGPVVTMPTPGTPPPPQEAPRLVRVTVSAEPPASAPASQPVVALRPTPPEPRHPSPVGLPLAARIGSLKPAECLAELDRLHIPYRREPPETGIATPIRLTGPVGGVRYLGQGRNPDATPFTLLDCRMALALNELSKILREHGVVTVHHYSIHRPHHRGKPVGSGGRTGHRGGMAIDLANLTLADGRTISVLKDFKGRRHTPVCGPKAAPGSTPEAKMLRAIVCTADELKLFNVLLTPNHDYPHRNHFHMEVRPDGVKWFVLH